MEHREGGGYGQTARRTKEVGGGCRSGEAEGGWGGGGPPTGTRGGERKKESRGSAVGWEKKEGTIVLKTNGNREGWAGLNVSIVPKEEAKWRGELNDQNQEAMSGRWGLSED